MIGKLTVCAALAAAIVAVATQRSSVSAQYPPPTGNCVISSSASTAIPGSSVAITVTVRDASGTPVANVAVPLSVASQPGSDASVATGSSATNASGQLPGTLNVGTTSGVVVVTASPAGTSCSASVVTGAGEVAGAVTLPNTGSGASGTPVPAAGLAVIALGGAGVIAAAVAMRRRAAR